MPQNIIFHRIQAHYRDIFTDKKRRDFRYRGYSCVFKFLLLFFRVLERKQLRKVWA